MTLRNKLAVRYAAVVGLCLALLGGLAWHEFVTEPAERKALGIPELHSSPWIEYAEVFFYGMIPVVLGGGWWIMRKTLAPVDRLALGVERIQAHNLHEALPRSGERDEVDRLTEAFNKMTARLGESFQQIREFTLHASHELKTPLTIMRTELETLLRDEQKLPREQREWARGQLDEVQRLANIVDSLTLLTKADAGLIILERKPVKLDELIRECFEDAQILAEARNVRVRLDACEPLVIVGDRNRLRQLLLNLADNAVKYNLPEGSVSLSLGRTEESAVVNVTNTGPGIPPELADKIFEPFVRGAEARVQAADGSGLGLAICQWIVQSHGGEIRIGTDSNSLTKAEVRLPLSTRGASS